MRMSIVVVILLASCHGAYALGFASWINLDNQIVLEPLGDRAVDLGGLDLQSEAALLIPGTSWQPFQFHLVNTEQQVTYGTLGFVVPRFEGSTTIDVRYDLSTALEKGLDPCEDLSLGLQGGGTGCTIPGDADFSGTVDFSDFLVLSDSYGQAGTAWPSGDFDWDRKTGFSDFLLLSENFGTDFYDRVTERNEPISVRASTSEEIAYLADEFSPEPLSPISPHGDYFVDEGFLWLHQPNTESDSEKLGDSPITIVASEIDYGRSTHFGAELRRIGDDFELVAVRLKSPFAGGAFQLPDDLGKSLVLPIGTLDDGQYDVEITRYEFANNGEVADFDVNGFLADPMNFELPDGPILSSLSTSTLTFQVGETGVASVPEPGLSRFSGAIVFLMGLASRRLFSKVSN